MKRKHLIAALITVAVIVGSLAFPAFAEATQTAEDPASSVASQDSVPTSSAPPPSSEPAPVPSESVSSSTEPEEPSSVYEEPSSQYYEEPSSVYEEPSSQYYEEPSSDDYGYNYEDSSTYTDSAITGSLLPETSADGASGTTSHNWDKLLENINSANAAGMEDGTFVFKDDPDNTNNTGANDGGWILWTGIGFIFLAVCGISYVIYANFFSKKCPRKRLAAAQAAQRARIQSSSAKRQVSQQQTLSSARAPRLLQLCLWRRLSLHH
ncbi:MAG: hypothetical protein ACLR30_06945 [[Clostridium] leptum]